MKLRISHLIDDIACAGLHPETARARVSSYAQNRLICFAAGTNTSPNIYRPEDSAVAIILSALQDCGVADLDLQRDVCLEIYLRIGRCLAGLTDGESWSLVVDVYRGTLGRFINAHLVRYGEAASPAMHPAFTPRGAIVVVLDEMLSPVVRRLNPPKGAN
ncbi:hypothetical protein [Mesorhizobium sp. ES1-4]|uniref:hypothetical protein n=1 Tax=Mesorhizobium sp. ES1-4 TaxID=2876627 RepID=UPI001CCC1083|nr:hypothetical protein [Mesorhizobium sp. ES1-4]MBZ9794809.1 hypothetical protein [Mesorhizobium sp. ES1-4]